MKLLCASCCLKKIKKAWLLPLAGFNHQNKQNRQTNKKKSVAGDRITMKRHQLIKRRRLNIYNLYQSYPTLQVPRLSGWIDG